MASDYQKPHGLTVILPDQAQDFLKQMDITKIHGVGKKQLNAFMKWAFILVRTYWTSQKLL